MSIFSNFTFAQANLSPDDLFLSARKAAFDTKDYPKAIQLSKQALKIAPDYEDIQIFLGRLYTWTKQNDSARTILTTTLTKHPDNEDACLALSNLEFWNDNSIEALKVTNQGLSKHPNSVALLLSKGKILNDLKRYSESAAEVNKILEIEPNNTEARSLSGRIKDKSSKNKIGLTYDYIHFDKQFSDPWQIISLDYSRLTSLGSVIGRVNYANRFRSNGIQFEIDAYPHLSKIFQAYVNGGYSNNVGIFPQYRAGFSLYANLPASFEAEAGFRYLRFTDNTWIYTASVGKYYKNFWFNLRTYLTPSNDNISHSLALTARYYYGGAEDYLTLKLGTGVSPDNIQNNVLIGSTTYKLMSNNFLIGARKSIKRLNVVFINFSMENQEYQPNVKGNQIDIGIGYNRRF